MPSKFPNHAKVVQTVQYKRLKDVKTVEVIKLTKKKAMSFSAKQRWSPIYSIDGELHVGYEQTGPAEEWMFESVGCGSPVTHCVLLNKG